MGHMHIHSEWEVGLCMEVLELSVIGKMIRGWVCMRASQSLWIFHLLLLLHLQANDSEWFRPFRILWMTLSFWHLHRERRSSEREYVSMNELSSHVFK